MLDDRSKRIIRCVVSSDTLATDVEKTELLNIVNGEATAVKSYTVKQVAMMISKSSATVYNLVAEGKLTAIRSGKSNRISSITGESVEKYLNG